MTRPASRAAAASLIGESVPGDTGTPAADVAKLRKLAEEPLNGTAGYHVLLFENDTSGIPASFRNPLCKMVDGRPANRPKRMQDVLKQLGKK